MAGYCTCVGGWFCEVHGVDNRGFLVAEQRTEVQELELIAGDLREQAMIQAQKGRLQLAGWLDHRADALDRVRGPVLTPEQAGWLLDSFGSTDAQIAEARAVLRQIAERGEDG